MATGDSEKSDPHLDDQGRLDRLRRLEELNRTIMWRLAMLIGALIGVGIWAAAEWLPVQVKAVVSLVSAILVFVAVVVTILQWRQVNQELKKLKSGGGP